MGLGFLLFGYNQCLVPLEVSSPKKPNTTTSASTNTSGVAGASRAVSVTAYKQSLYPIMTAHCAGCHSTFQTPLMASADINIAYDALANTSKVDFTNPANSRLVLKLRNEKHNCWGDCVANSQEIEDQIVNWQKLLSATSTDVGSTNVTGKITKESLVVSDILNPQNALDSGTITLMTESASLKQPMIKSVDGLTSFIWIPTAAQVLDLSSADAGLGYLNFSPAVSDFYKIYMLVNVPSETSNQIYVKATGSEYKEWSADTTNGFEWRELTNTPQKIETSFYFTAGKPYTLELRQKEAGMKISKVVVTNDSTYNPSMAPSVSLKGTISVSIADISGVANAFLDIDIEEYDLYSYKLSNPRIRTPKDLKIKKLKVLVNGTFNPQHSTYFTVNKTVTKADPIVSAFSMILLKDKGSDFDKLSFSFDTIEPVVK